MVFSQNCFEREWIFVPQIKNDNLYDLQPDVVDLLYFKLWIWLGHKVWNINSVPFGENCKTICYLSWKLLYWTSLILIAKSLYPLRTLLISLWNLFFWISLVGFRVPTNESSNIDYAKPHLGFRLVTLCFYNRHLDWLHFRYFPGYYSKIKSILRLTKRGYKALILISNNSKVFSSDSKNYHLFLWKSYKYSKKNKLMKSKVILKKIVSMFIFIKESCPYLMVIQASLWYLQIFYF